MNLTLDRVTNRRPTVIAGVVGLGIGVLAAYIHGRLTREPEEYIYHEPRVRTAKVSEIREYIDGKKADELIEDEPTQDKVNEFLQKQLTRPLRPERTSLHPSEAVQVFASDKDPNWDYDEELKHRSDQEPYVIHYDEFFARETEYDQSQFVWYAGDEIMCDDLTSQIIYNHNEVVGELKFGHGTGDPNVFYVRNDKHEMEYEITRDPGLYHEERQGLFMEDPEELEDFRHSNTVPKFRRE